MKAPRPSTFPPSAALRLLGGWVLLLIVVFGLSALLERQKLLSELQTEAHILHRLASQRADQHDAHLTSLSALATAGEDARRDLFLDVGASILRFYPRISAIDLVPLDGISYLTGRTGLPEETIALIQRSARETNGQLMLAPAPGAPGGYLLVKRSPNTDNARFGLALQIDAQALLASDSSFWSRPSVSRNLHLPDGTALMGGGTAAGVQFEKILGSASQPLVFAAGISPSLTDLLPPGRLLAAAVLATVLYLLSVLGLRQLFRARQAETQARLSAQDARLAHASRVNTLGEMASGMAHELTQPLTAILSQAQAGRHLAARGDPDQLAQVFDGIAGQAKRASAILGRLRNWTRPRQGRAAPVQVQEAVKGVELLLRPEAERAGIQLKAGPVPPSLMVRADPVELEQVLFNLVRNAIEAASQGGEKRVSLTAQRSGSDVLIEVADSGPGVPADIRPRLFEPFVTGKPGGTGLGLALCQRLSERMGGDLSLALDTAETVFRLRLPDAQTLTAEAAE
ncbi:sensor histidine kinase [Leisingera sp. McT4-56]|uniref:sensor histidine kinase n=1 Tax=Leisingera sp. McT4-56 TaxID=2881255 RepID=UPI001CF8C952|nr:ATP-binding protein [Leisingera sp. McT4-56]MCB4455981.1 two-component sensor histidine kinase [Leisingera sp. McT4-56]